jgi:hypothetical protein
MSETKVVPFVMLPGTGPACEGDDCLPAASLVDEVPAS